VAIKPWKKLAEERTSIGHRHVLMRTFRRAGGAVVDYQVKDEPDAVSILALTPEWRVLLVRQFRVGPELAVDELPGGNKEDDESPRAAAARELREETGFIPGNLSYVGASLDCAYSTRRRHHFVATNCVFAGHPTGDGAEELEVVLVPLSVFRRRLRAGMLTDVSGGYRCLDAAGLLGSVLPGGPAGVHEELDRSTMSAHDGLDRPQDGPA
jgi:ADP-ribose pyrophosphatase